MEGGTVTLPPNKNKLAKPELQIKWRELEQGFQTALVTAGHALKGAAWGAVFGALTGSFLGNWPQIEGSGTFPFIVGAARDFAIFRGTSEGMICAMQRIRGEDDTKARMVAGFTSGLVTTVVGPKPFPASQAVNTGLFFALCYGLMHKVFGSSQPPVLEGTCYTKTRCMLLNLGLQKYEKRFRKHLLTDNTMPLLNRSDLVEAGIPLGPSILILNHIQRDLDLQKMRGS
ncbi:hypothetical protein MKW94_015966 [Papaver nudicaule]|uniref:Mitochondrial import inner membrane translocase subunit Tim17/Tim22/Tim23 family protein n=1 Tax=Papaver nudicaule TaxID=74823 RepID=A0AA41VX90_PAPNU|nr:hypothetical protein [Papaver nudicaule]